MKFKLASFDTGDTWNVTASSEKLAISKLVKKYPYLNGDLHCISCTHSSSELKTKKNMAKKSKKPLSAYKVKLSFKSKAGKTFTKGFLSLSSAKRAVAGWKSAGGQMAGKMKTTKSGRTYRSKIAR
jgi:hypothetical protein